ANIDEVESEVVEIEAKLDKQATRCASCETHKRHKRHKFHLFPSTLGCYTAIMHLVKVLAAGWDTILFDQAQRSVKQQLHNFETKKHFDRVREDLEIAQVKNAQAPRNKPHEVEEATSTLSITRKCFRHLALDYVLQINVLKAKKKFEILDAMLSFMHAQYSLFQQGYNLLHDIDPYMKKAGRRALTLCLHCAWLDQLVIDSAMEKRDMEHKHATIQQRALVVVVVVVVVVWMRLAEPEGTGEEATLL
ncbi:LOW QUALITY PROTEIN: hypothetical protein CRUP_001510, partial [Coryphaenoides rupestris]